MDVSVNVTEHALETRRLTLRALRMGDLEDFYAYASVPGVGERAGWKHHESREESEKILRSLVESKDIFAIVHRESGRVIGTLGLHPSFANALPEYAALRMKEIGYVLSQDYWGQGLIPEAVSAVIRWGFDTLMLDAFTCCHFAENARSRRVIEKCGFRFAGIGEFVSEALQKTFVDLQYIRFREP